MNIKQTTTKTIQWIGQNLVLVSAIITGIILISPTNQYDKFMMETGMNQSMSISDINSDFMEAEEAPRSMAKMAMVPSAFAEDFAPEKVERKIIRNASLQVEVADTETAKTEVEKIAQNFHGHITNLNSYEVRPEVLSYNLTVRIPSENLSAALAKFTALGIKKSESMSEQDITAQYADLQNRLQNLETRRARLRELMERKTDDLSDVLAIDRDLSSVQEEIERLQRNLKRHDTNVAYSKINLSLQPEPEIGDFQTPEWTPKRSWKQSVNDLIVSAQHILDKAIQILVFAPIWLPLLVLLVIIQKFIRRKQKALIKLKK